jgi:Cysteine rich domain with multizinc binding regions/Zinc finger, C3HC4 type (RING finger)
MGVGAQCKPLDITLSPCTIGSAADNTVVVVGVSHMACVLSKVDDFSAVLTSFVDHIAINEKPVPINTQIKLYSGDVIVLDKRKMADAEQPSNFLFMLVHDHLKRTTPSDSILQKPTTRVLTSLPSQAPTDNAQVEATENSSGLSDELSCGICLDLLHNCVTLVSCLHNFCGACITSWLKNGTCPLCKAAITKAKKNAPINNIVASVLQKHPEKVRPQAELEQMDKRDLFRDKNEIEVRRREQTDDLSHGLLGRLLDIDDSMGDSFEFMVDDDSGDEEDSEYLQCPECEFPRQTDGFQCTLDQHHESCRSCDREMPNRTDTHVQRCQACNHFYCGLYLGNCRGDIELRRLQDHGPPGALSDHTFRGNMHDLAVSASQSGFARVYAEQRRIDTVHLGLYDGKLRQRREWICSCKRSYYVPEYVP